jgi:hypothetical protein
VREAAGGYKVGFPPPLDTSPVLQMLYYRFRPSGELSLKELLYDEMFFTSASECNDPFDGASFFSFGCDEERWARLIEHSWGRAEPGNKSDLARGLARAVASRCPMSLSDAQAMVFDEALKHLASLGPLAAGILAGQLRAFIRLYEPRRPYFVSFAKAADNALMWAHYGSMHQGHCLVFRSFDGSLHQHPDRLRTVIHRTTQSGIAPSITIALPGKFQFDEVIYEDGTGAGDAFTCFPQPVAGLTLSDEERLSLNVSRRRQVLTKHTCWRYEQEARVILSPPSSWVFGDPVELTPFERLFHFMPSQLVGIVLGAKMPTATKERVREIAVARSAQLAQKLAKGGPCLDFVIFQARLISSERSLAIDPVELVSLGTVVPKEAPKFSTKLSDWEEGRGLLFREGGASKKQFA